MSSSFKHYQSQNKCNRCNVVLHFNDNGAHLQCPQFFVSYLTIGNLKWLKSVSEAVVERNWCVDLQSLWAITYCFRHITIEIVPIKVDENIFWCVVLHKQSNQESRAAALFWVLIFMFSRALASNYNWKVPICVDWWKHLLHR